MNNRIALTVSTAEKEKFKSELGKENITYRDFSLRRPGEAQWKTFRITEKKAPDVHGTSTGREAFRQIAIELAKLNAAAMLACGNGVYKHMLTAEAYKGLDEGKQYYNAISVPGAGGATVQYYLFTYSNKPELFRRLCDFADALNIEIEIGYEGKDAQPAGPAPDPAPKQLQPIQKEIQEMIEEGMHQIILTGAPGTGKTYLVRELAKSMVEKGQEDTHIKFVQFHPSYDYTDFVEGLRPVDEGGSMQFKRMDGVFKKFCRYVAWQNECGGSTDERYFFIIDEINRADLSKVFGELMFCLEGDKRGPENKVVTQYANLDTHFSKAEQEKEYGADPNYTGLFKETFYIPKNVVVIGTMNDIDRSVESMDFALRRRFVWKPVLVEQVLEQAFTNGDFLKWIGDEGLRAKVMKRLTGRVLDFNEEMTRITELKSDYHISQGQFAGLPEGKFAGITDPDELADKIMLWVWNWRVSSLLKEYLRGDYSADKHLPELEQFWLHHKPAVKATTAPNDSAPQSGQPAGDTLPAAPDADGAVTDEDEGGDE